MPLPLQIIITVSTLITVLSLAYYVLMYILGIDVGPIYTGKKLLHIERIQYMPKAQSIVCVSDMRRLREYYTHVNMRLAEYGIERTLPTSTWTEHTTDSYSVYTLNK